MNLKTITMTPAAKRYIKLNEQIESNRNKFERYDSGFNYDKVASYFWQNKAAVSQAKQDQLVLSAEDKQDIEEFYGCGEMF
jgi:hypothetical protein